ncbi:MAG: hypothetical protein HOO96_06300 [Polyangiaceae bacterium]|nr:hypothetical protein [Polyangiaceae bacterium]
MVRALPLVLIALCASCDTFSSPSPAVVADGGGDGATDAGTDADASLSAEGGTDAAPLLPRRVFVTVAVFDGRLMYAGKSGIEGADAACNAEADDARLGARFKAWLSVPGAKAPGRFTVPARDIELPGGEHVAKGFSDLVNMGPRTPIAQTAKKAPVAATASVYTGTDVTGDASANHCDNWTSPTGLGTYGLPSTKDLWTDAAPAAVACTVLRQVYCFEE